MQTTKHGILPCHGRRLRRHARSPQMMRVESAVAPIVPFLGPALAVLRHRGVLVLNRAGLSRNPREYEFYVWTKGLNSFMSAILPINLDDLVYCRGVESERVEFKGSWDPRATGPQVLRTICAFANDYHNLNGGYIAIGIEERADGPSCPRRACPPRRSRRHSDGFAVSATGLIPSTNPSCRPRQWMTASSWWFGHQRVTRDRIGLPPTVLDRVGTGFASTPKRSMPNNEAVCLENSYSRQPASLG